MWDLVFAGLQPGEVILGSLNLGMFLRTDYEGAWPPPKPERPVSRKPLFLF